MNIENLMTVGSRDQSLQGNQTIAFSVLGDPLCQDSCRL